MSGPQQTNYKRYHMINLESQLQLCVPINIKAAYEEDLV